MKTNLILLLTLSFLFSCTDEEMKNKAADYSDMEFNSKHLADVDIENVKSTSEYETDYFTGSKTAINTFCKQAPEGMLGAFKFKGIHGKNGFGGRYKNENGPELTVDKPDTTDYPKTITIDYGSGITTKHGSVISGKKIISISAQPRTDGSTRVVRFENFKIDSISFSGSITKKFSSTTDSSGVQTISGDRIFTYDNGLVVTTTVSEQIEWISGINTEYTPKDDSFARTGTVQTVKSTGETYTKEITKALKKVAEHPYIVEGVVEYKENGEVKKVVDYGDGSLDNKFSVTQDGVTTEYEMRPPHKRHEGNKKGHKRGKKGGKHHR